MRDCKIINFSVCGSEAIAENRQRVFNRIQPPELSCIDFSDNAHGKQLLCITPGVLFVKGRDTGLEQFVMLG